ncbi:MAG: hypothetical protein U9R01_00940 [candidate division WOR-3 bacterium]|nr:hypothetical protein [candidate division WOR-3 bacterium]
MIDDTEKQANRIADEIASFIGELAIEGERSAVVLGAARLDLGLERLLKRIMQHHPGGTDNLFDPERPLSSFSTKIALSFRLGLINSAFEHGLQMIRKIRNDFAHSIDKVSLSKSPHKDRVMELSKIAKKNKLWRRLHDNLSRAIKSDLLSQFCTAMAVLIANLEIAELLSVPSEPRFKCRMDWGQ